MYVLVTRKARSLQMMEAPLGLTPCEPASPRRCFESGSSSEKYVTGHACIGDQVHDGKNNATGRRQRARIAIRAITQRCRKIFNRFRKNYCCVNKGSVKIVSSCSDNIMDTARSDQASNGSDTKVEKIQVPTVEFDHSFSDSCSDTNVDLIHVPTVEFDHVSRSSSDTCVNIIHVPTVECDHVSDSCSDTRVDKIQVPAARNEQASYSSDTKVDKNQVPTIEFDHVSDCSDTCIDGMQEPAAHSDHVTHCSDNETEAPMAQCDTSLKKPENSSPSPNRRVIRVFHKPVELHHAAQPWKARKDCSTNDVTRKAKVILNKISPDNFEKLTRQLKSLNVEDEKDASDLANVLFQKAVEDQTYAYLYAKVCRDLMKSFYIILETANPDDFERVVNFRFILAMKAKNEFVQLFLQLGGEPSSSQRRYNRGILNFLAELMNQNVLTERAVGQEILKALSQYWSNNESDHYAIECLCTFLTVAGKALDFPNNQQQSQSRRNINLCFELLQVLAEPKGLLNSRLRFMILDLIELRRNVWMKKH